MKNILFKSILITALALFGWQGTSFAQQSKTAADSLEKARLAVRSELFMAKNAAKQRELQSRAAAMQIPMLKREGQKTYALRDITPAGEPIYDIPDNLISVETLSGDQVKAGGGLGLALTGAGQTLGIWEAFDDGNASVRGTHVEFGGRVTITDGGGSSNHGTHVAGTMIAAGVDANAEGFSTGADLISFDITNDVAEMDVAAKAATPIRISNHSYGSRAGWVRNEDTGVWEWTAGAATEDWKFGAYSSTAQAWDEVAFNNPFLTIFKAAGNDRGNGPGPNPPGVMQDGGALGFDCIPTYGTSKNIVTVGAVNDVAGGYTAPGSVTMSTFSGWGPTDDGRIKPDIVANGVGVYSSVGTGDTDYDGTYDGTSMSTPAVAGGSGLLLEHWGNVLGGAPRSATLKGLLIEMADECGGANGPDYSFGWGLANIADAAQLITIEGYDGCRQYVEGSVSDGDVFTYDIFSEGLSPIKVTLTWTDVESATVNNSAVNPAAASYLVNNLDLRVDGGGGTAFPWVLDPANPANTAFAGDNNRDNVEQVLILSPVAGVYTIRVVAPATVTDGPQRFTLWFSGNGSAEEDITVSGVNINTARTFAARRNIVFGPLPVNITAPANVSAYAGKSVRLMPGFHAFTGSTFLAKILPGGGCGLWSGDLKTDNYSGLKAVVLGDGERSWMDTPAGSVSALSLALSPNPTSGLLTARWELDNPTIPVTLRILDQQGREVSRLPIKNAAVQTQMDLSTLAVGIYSCVVDNGLQRVSKQFVIGE